MSEVAVHRREGHVDVFRPKTVRLASPKGGQGSIHRTGGCLSVVVKMRELTGLQAAKGMDERDI